MVNSDDTSEGVLLQCIYLTYLYLFNFYYKVVSNQSGTSIKHAKSFLIIFVSI